MRDEEYAADQIPSYGTVGQPAAVRRLARHLRTVRIGTAVAVAAVLASAVALITYGDGWDGTGTGWAVGLLVAAVGLAVVCGLQLWAWTVARAAWDSRRSADTRRLRSLGAAAQLVGYLMSVLGLICGIAVVVTIGWAATAALAALLTLILMGVALVAAGVQYVHRSGPPGAAPAHMRQVVARQARTRSGGAASGPSR